METPKPSSEQWNPEASIARKPSRIAQAASEWGCPCPGLGQVLADARKACGLSQAFLAEHLQVSLRTVKRWESGRTVPRWKRLEYLFAYLEIPVQEALRTKRRLCGLPASGLDEFTDLLVQ